MPYDGYEAVLKSSLDDLSDNIQKILQNDELRKTLMLNGENFIKQYYNIPETNPKLLIEKITG